MIFKRLLSTLFVAGTVLFLWHTLAVQAQDPIRVTTSGGVADGSDWGTKAASLQHALSIAGDGDEIWVASGVYTPGLKRTDTFTLPAGVSLYGGFATTEITRTERDWAANLTILSGDIDGNDTTTAGVVMNAPQIVGNNAYHVMVASGYAASPITESTVVDGVIITGGQANSANVPHDRGGGLYCIGQANGGDCSPVLRNVIFSGNTATAGGAMFNNAYNGGQSNPQMLNTLFRGNWAANDGGAIYNDAREGGQSSPVLVNVTISGNRAVFGGALLNDADGGGTSKPVLGNVIVWGNTATNQGNQFYNISATPQLSYTLLQNGTNDVINESGSSVTFGPGIINRDPQFTDATNGDFRLQTGSPAIDVGFNSASFNIFGIAATVFGVKDLAGSRRISNQVIDLGAYETPFTCPTGSGPLVFVNSAAAGANDGTSWTNAYTNLQNGLTAADECAAFNEVWVATGVYTPGATVSDTFRLPPHTQIYGGFTATETTRTQRDWAANPTILSGDIGGDDTTTAGVVMTTGHIVGKNAYHVVASNRIPNGNITATTVLDGFTITAGASIDNPDWLQDAGGGFSCLGLFGVCSPRMRNIIFQGNTASFGGAMAMYGVFGESSPTFTNVIFNGNRATAGGALALGSVLGAAQPRFINVTISGNEAAEKGGGIFAQNTATLHLTNTILWGNSAALSGTQIFNDGPGVTTNINYTLLQTTTGAIENVNGGNIVVGPGILTTDPKFVNAAEGNLQLGINSPAINAGDNGSVSGVSADLAGNPRVQDGTVDLGAYEASPTRNIYLPLVLKNNGT